MSKFSIHSDNVATTRSGDRLAGFEFFEAGSRYAACTGFSLDSMCLAQFCLCSTRTGIRWPKMRPKLLVFLSYCWQWAVGLTAPTRSNYKVDAPMPKNQATRCDSSLRGMATYKFRFQNHSED